MKLALLCLLLTSCSLFYSGNQHPEGRWGYMVEGEPYPVTAAQVSPAGVHFDPTGQPISGALIDRLVGEVETCLAKSLDRSAFAVKVASDWELSCDKTQQVLP